MLDVRSTTQVNEGATPVHCGGIRLHLLIDDPQLRGGEDISEIWDFGKGIMSSRGYMSGMSSRLSSVLLLLQRFHERGEM